MNWIDLFGLAVIAGMVLVTVISWRRYQRRGHDDAVL